MMPYHTAVLLMIAACGASQSTGSGPRVDALPPAMTSPPAIVLVELTTDATHPTTNYWLAAPQWSVVEAEEPELSGGKLRKYVSRQTTNRAVGAIRKTADGCKLSYPELHQSRFVDSTMSVVEMLSVFDNETEATLIEKAPSEEWSAPCGDMPAAPTIHR